MIRKTIISTSIIALLGFAAPAFAAPEAAPAAPVAAASGATFGIVDVNKIMQTSDAAKDIFSQLEGKRKEYQTQIAKEEDALRSAEQELVKQKDTLSKEEFDKKRKAFEEKVIEGQKLVQEKKHTLDVALNGAMNNLRREVAKIVAAAAEEKHYSAVFTQDAVMISMPDMDMTDVVIERMNKSVKKIPVDWAAAASDNAAKKKK